MKYAAAMRYGGELIEALECDYDDFKELLPLCPECHEPVYLRKASERLLRDKRKICIPAHWCHFSPVDTDCTLYKGKGSLSPSSVSRLQGLARGQRLRLIEENILRIFRAESAPNTFPEHLPKPKAIAKINKYASGECPGIYEEVQALTGKKFHDIGKSCLDLLAAPESTYVKALVYKARDIRHSLPFKNAPAEVELHQKICEEVYGFLRTAKGRAMKNLLIKCAVESCVPYIDETRAIFAKVGTMEDQRSVEHLHQVFLPSLFRENALRTFIACIYTVPWIKRLNSTSADSPAPVATRS